MIVLTGGTGFLGRHLRRALLASEEEVVLLKRALSNTDPIKNILDRMVMVNRDNVEKLLSIGRIDPIIAAHATAVDTVCVTDNLRCFLRIPQPTIED